MSIASWLGERELVVAQAEAVKEKIGRMIESETPGLCGIGF